LVKKGFSCVNRLGRNYERHIINPSVRRYTKVSLQKQDNYKGRGGEESCRLADSETVWLAAYAHFQAGLANITSVGMSSVKFIHHQTVHHSHGHLGCNLLRHTHINTQFYSASFILVDRLRNLKKDYAYLPSKFWAGARHFMLVHYQRADDFLLVSS